MNARCCLALMLCWVPGWSNLTAAAQGTTDPFPAQREAGAEGSSKAMLPEAPGTDETVALNVNPGTAVIRSPATSSASRPAGMRPFSTAAIGLKVGLAGIGLELATPLAARLNLRVGGSFLSLNPQFTEDGIHILGDVQMRSGFVALDVFPFGRSFHISPGYTLYNGNHLSTKAMVPPGQDFDLGDGTYTSDTTDPVHGAFNLSLGSKSAPRLTFGWGNMIPRTGRRWSFPFEIGAEYLGKPPQVTLTLAGTVCQGPGFCQPIQQNPTAQQNVLLEQAEINSDIPSWLRFFPLVSTGISYRFGHSPSGTR